MKLTKGLIKADIIAARQAMEYFGQTRNKDIKNIAAYHLQQAAEKLIKIQIYKLQQSTDNKKNVYARSEQTDRLCGIRKSQFECAKLYQRSREQYYRMGSRKQIRYRVFNPY